MGEGGLDILPMGSLPDALKLTQSLDLSLALSLPQELMNWSENQMDKAMLDLLGEQEAPKPTEDTQRQADFPTVAQPQWQATAVSSMALPPRSVTSGNGLNMGLLLPASAAAAAMRPIGGCTVTTAQPPARQVPCHFEKLPADSEVINNVVGGVTAAQDAIDDSGSDSGESGDNSDYEQCFSDEPAYRKPRTTRGQQGRQGPVRDVSSEPSSSKGGSGGSASGDKKKVGRPITYKGDPNAPHLTEGERKRIKRRIANRESARRVRQKRLELLDELQIKIQELQFQQSRLLNHVQEVEGSKTLLASQLELVKSKWNEANEENLKLHSEMATLRKCLEQLSGGAGMQSTATGLDSMSSASSAFFNTAGDGNAFAPALPSMAAMDSMCAGMDMAGSGLECWGL